MTGPGLFDNGSGFSQPPPPAYEEREAPEKHGIIATLFSYLFFFGLILFLPYVVALAMFADLAILPNWNRLVEMHVTAPYWASGLGGLMVVSYTVILFTMAPRWFSLCYSMFCTSIVSVTIFVMVDAFGPHLFMKINLINPLSSLLFDNYVFATITSDPLMLISAIGPGIFIGYFIGKFNIWLMSGRHVEENEEQQYLQPHQEADLRPSTTKEDPGD